jgi:hypothetical protein
MSVPLPQCLLEAHRLYMTKWMETRASMIPTTLPRVDFPPGPVEFTKLENLKINSQLNQTERIEEELDFLRRIGGFHQKCSKIIQKVKRGDDEELPNAIGMIECDGSCQVIVDSEIYSLYRLAENDWVILYAQDEDWKESVIDFEILSNQFVTHFYPTENLICIDFNDSDPYVQSNIRLSVNRALGLPFGQDLLEIARALIQKYHRAKDTSALLKCLAVCEAFRTEYPEDEEVYPPMLEARWLADSARGDLLNEEILELVGTKVVNPAVLDQIQTIKLKFSK